MMNLIVNSIDAMKEVDGARELAVQSQRAENEQLQVSVSDTGVGLPPQQADQIFKAFFTTTAWGSASAAPSLNRMAGACGLPTTLRAAQAFVSFSPPSLRVNDACGRSHSVRH
jgi:phosphoglycerate-specific signal transduction histidine kinase